MGIESIHLLQLTLITLLNDFLKRIQICWRINNGRENKRNLEDEKQMDEGELT